MKKPQFSQITSLISLSILTVGISSCGVVPGTSVVTVEPGFAGLKIKLYGGEKGIDNAQLVSGRALATIKTHQSLSLTCPVWSMLLYIIAEKIFLVKN